MSNNCVFLLNHHYKYTGAGIHTGTGNIYCLDTSTWDTSTITDMSAMFRGFENLCFLNLSNFNTSLVTNMSYMFYNCVSLTSLDLSSFNTSACTNMSNMFLDCASLTSLDLSSFNTSLVTNMDNMFSACGHLTNLTLGADWGINASITSLHFQYFYLTHDSCLDVFNKLADKTQTATTSATLILNSITKALMSDDEIAIATAKGWTVSS